jgi:hypothetical protein
LTSRPIFLFFCGAFGAVVHLGAAVAAPVAV